MIEEKEKTAGITSVGADERQSTSKTSAIVTDSEPECNSKKKKLRELTRLCWRAEDRQKLFDAADRVSREHRASFMGVSCLKKSGAVSCAGRQL